MTLQKQQDIIIYGSDPSKTTGPALLTQGKLCAIFKLRILKCRAIYIRASTGFDGDFEVWEAIRGSRDHVKT